MTDQLDLIVGEKYVITRPYTHERETIYLGNIDFGNHISHKFIDWAVEPNGAIIKTSISQNNLILDGKKALDKSNTYFSTLIEKDMREWSRLAGMLRRHNR